MKHVYSKKGYTPEMLADKPLMDFTNETNRILSHGMNKGIATEVPEVMLNSLQNDVFLFSGFKTHAELKEASSLLLDANNNIKPFQEFKQDVLSLNNTYNSAYLDAEYNFAIGSAQMASKWADFEKDSDRYNLQYRTAMDDRVREEHAALEGITLPVDDPFWNDYLPPNGWNCRCTTVEVRDGKYPVSDSQESIDKGEAATTVINKNGENTAAIFRFNPGKDKVIFPPNHPYRQVQQSVKNIIEGLPGNKNEWETVETKKGSVRVNLNHGSNEREENISIASYLANKHGYEIDLLPIVEGTKNPDSYNKTLKIVQEYKTNYTATKGAIDKEIRDAAKQADHVVIRINSTISDSDLMRGIKGRVNQEKNIKSVTVIRKNKDKTYKRSDIMSKGFKL